MKSRLRLAITTSLRRLALWFAAPGALAVLLYWQETFIFQCLATSLGTTAAIVWTGWLGTPIHEMSHAVVALLFGHRVDKVVLFAPAADGTLGYVTHSYDPHSLWQQIGNFPIGIAPLIGGALAMYGVGKILLAPRGAARKGQRAATPTVAGQLLAAWRFAADVGLRGADPRSWRFWIFLYFVLCVGAHIAPSGADLRGALPGFVAFVALLFATHLVLALARVDEEKLATAGAGLFAPLAALLMLAAVLNTVNLAAVWLVTRALPG